jgi:hypothetical protein
MLCAVMLRFFTLIVISVSVTTLIVLILSCQSAECRGTDVTFSKVPLDKLGIQE